MASAASNVMLAHKWADAINPKGWWMSEKLDGVRAYWSGSYFFSRNGNKFAAPAWFTADLPKVPLDGELWAGRGQFKNALSIAKSFSGDQNRWQCISFAAFDAPQLTSVDGSPAPYEARVEWLQQNLATTRYASAVPIASCSSKSHLETTLAAVEKVGGEGLMLRRPKSMYEHGRSHALLKVKSFCDEEGIVTGHTQGKGNNLFVTGALLLRTPDGRSVKVGSGLSDAQRRKPPKKGAIVTYKYFEVTAKGAPRFPTFVGERTDLDWDTYCAQYTAPSAANPRPLKRKNSIMFGDRIGYSGGEESETESDINECKANQADDALSVTEPKLKRARRV